MSLILRSLSSGLPSEKLLSVEAQVITEKRHMGKGLVPSGMSVGKYEGWKIYGGEVRYRGFGVRQAVRNVNETIAPALIGMDVVCQNQVDTSMIELDGTEDKSRLGATQSGIRGLDPVPALVFWA